MRRINDNSPQMSVWKYVWAGQRKMILELNMRCTWLAEFEIYLDSRGQEFVEEFPLQC